MSERVYGPAVESGFKYVDEKGLRWRMGTRVVPEVKAVIQWKTGPFALMSCSRCDKGWELTVERYTEIEGRKINFLGPCLFFFWPSWVLVVACGI